MRLWSMPHVLVYHAHVYLAHVYGASRTRLPHALVHDASTEAIKALLKHGADVMASTDSGSVTPLGAAMLRYGLLVCLVAARVYAQVGHVGAYGRNEMSCISGELARPSDEPSRQS